jgi:hypothetical protein
MSKIIRDWVLNDSDYFRKKGFNVEVKSHLSDEFSSVQLHNDRWILGVIAWDHNNIAEIDFILIDTGENIVEERTISNENELSEYFREFVSLHCI